MVYIAPKNPVTLEQMESGVLYFCPAIHLKGVYQYA